MRIIILNKSRKLLFTVIIVGLFILINNRIVSNSTSELIFDNCENLHEVEFSLLLGTPKYLPNGEVNNYYQNRINSTVELYKNKIVKKIIISADTLNKYKENEVELIKNDLVQNGINELDLLSDNNGYRTWNSIIGVKDIVNQKQEVILISQRFHLERALYLANKKDIKAIGFVAKGKISKKLWLREILARVKMKIELVFK